MGRRLQLDAYRRRFREQRGAGWRPRLRRGRRRCARLHELSRIHARRIPQLAWRHLRRAQPGLPVRPIPMTTRLALILALIAPVGAAAGAAETAKPCCAEDTKLVAPIARPPGRSVYQIDSTWTDDAGRQAKLSSLQGGPVVLAMFFTN